MKIKSLLAYSVPLMMLLLVMAVIAARPPEPLRTTLCNYSMCMTLSGFQGWPNLR